MTERSHSAEERLRSLSNDRQKLLELLFERRNRDTQEIRPYPRTTDSSGRVLLPTSWAQQRLWFIDQLEGTGTAYNVPVVVRLHGNLDQKALQAALCALVQRHEVLRTIIVNVEGEPRQEIAASGRFELQSIDLSGIVESDQAQVRLQKIAEAQMPFDLRLGPLIRGRLLKLRPDEHVLIITMHHIVSDAWSMNVMLQELAELYSAYSEGSSDPLQPLPVQYADYALWQRQWLQGPILDKQLSYWRGRLADAAPELELPTDRGRPAVQGYRGQSFEFVLDSSQSAEIKTLARRHGLTLFMVFYAGWAILLSRLSGQEDIVIGTPVLNRPRPELERLIGFFVNTLALRIEVSPDMQLTDFLQHVKEVAIGAFNHQDVPFEHLVEALRPERSLRCHPIFQVMFALQSAPQSELNFHGLSAAFEDGVDETSKFDLLLLLEERGDQIKGRVTYDTELFDRITIERTIACFIVLLKSMTVAEQSPIANLPILPLSERRRGIELFNATDAPYSKEKLIHELFEAQVQRTPNAVSVTHEDRSLTYAELNAKANQLARYLRSEGIGPDKLVGICAERSLEMVIGLLAILKAGGAYLPLDPNYPPDRLQQMLDDSAPPLVLTQTHLTSVLAATRAKLVLLNPEFREMQGYAQENLLPADLGLTSQNLLYVIYTSGSTGQPKGTAMPHRAMVNLIEWHRNSIPTSEGCRVLQYAALSFDVAFQEIFSTICAGGVLVLLDESVRRDAGALLELLSNQLVERLFVPPMMLQSLSECLKTTGTAPRRLADVITAGERLCITPEIINFFKQVGECRLHNHYGPTETHVVTALTLPGSPDEWPATPTIGQPISNTQIYILDPQRQLMPVGVSGEIYIGGANVARGYLNRPELTAKRFLRNPFRATERSLLYMTGDLGRWRADGTVEYLGRNDDQVKIRGYRIELGEIETLLTRHPQVREAAVVAREDVQDEKRLVAYITVRQRIGPPVAELRAHLKRTLPDYMVPSAVVILDQMPLTLSGKLNRRALPPPEQGAYASEEYQAPEGSIEEALAEIWRELLRTDRIGRHDNFFELGGHSLLVVKALFRINQSLRVSLRVTDVYRSPTIRELAARICSGTVKDDFVDLAREAILDRKIVVLPMRQLNPAKALLLTGATGFVGRFVLVRLLEDTDAKIYCLVRAGSADEAATRLRTNLSHWDLWLQEFEQRIVAVPGDLRLPRFGLNDANYQILSQEVDSIYHCATSMNHLETYAMAKAANVDSVNELLILATRHKPKGINYISTLGIV